MTRVSPGNWVGQGAEDSYGCKEVGSCLCRYSPFLNFSQINLKESLEVFQLGLCTLSLGLGRCEKS